MNRKLKAALHRDNEREAAGMHPDDRETCWTHQSWATDCEDHPLHTTPSRFTFPGGITPN